MTNTNINIDNLNLAQLNELLKEVRLYRDLKKQLWNRWVSLYNKLKNNSNILLVEYFPAISEDLAWEEAKVIFKKVFNLNEVSRENVVFSKKETIKGWIRVYVDDKVIDLSYEKIERMVRK